MARPFRALLPGRLGSMLALAPASVAGPSAVDRPQVFPAEGTRRKRVALMTGCAQRVLRAGINEATVRLLRRHGCEVVIADGQGCCGALVHHMGKEEAAHAQAKANIAAWEKAVAQGGLDAIVINASGCGTMVKDYGWMFRNDPEWAERAARVSALAKDITEVMLDLGLAPRPMRGLPVVTYHSACSMRHGQKLVEQPKALLRKAGFEVREPAEAHLCCGSAGTYNILQPALAGRLQARKIDNLLRAGGEVIATGNIGCLVQIESGLPAAGPAVMHTVELLDWATGGPKPPGVG
jgi:glycolate oxidase iron-sulfur subunit